MIFYKFFPGDYQRDTNGLTMLQDGAYRRLLDEYYSKNGPITALEKGIFRIVRAFTPREREAVKHVLDNFFELRDGKYHNSRADSQIQQSKERSEVARGSANSRWGKRKQDTSAMRTHNKGINERIYERNASHSQIPEARATSQTPEAITPSKPSRSVEEEKEKKRLLPIPNSTDRPTDSRKNGYRATLRDAEQLNSLMFCATGRAETDQTALSWLRLTRSAGSFERVKQVLELKLRKHKPNSNAWFKAVLTDQFGISPDDAKAERQKFIERYREAIRIEDPDKRKAAAQACSEEASEAGVSVLNSI